MQAQLPELKVCFHNLALDGSDVLVLPDSLNQKFITHEEVNKRWENFRQLHIQKFGSMTGEANASSSRQAPSLRPEAEHGSPPQCLKPIQEVREAQLADCKLYIKGQKFNAHVITAGDRTELWMSGWEDKDQEVPEGEVLFGFGLGKWAHGSGEGVSFELHSDADLLVLCLAWLPTAVGDDVVRIRLVCAAVWHAAVRNNCLLLFMTAFQCRIRLRSGCGQVVINWGCVRGFWL